MLLDARIILLFLMIGMLGWYTTMSFLMIRSKLLGQGNGLSLGMGAIFLAMLLESAWAIFLVVRNAYSVMDPLVTWVGIAIYIALAMPVTYVTYGLFSQRFESDDKAENSDHNHR